MKITKKGKFEINTETNETNNSKQARLDESQFGLGKLNLLRK